MPTKEDKLETAIKEINILKEKFDRIRTLSRMYPEDVFPEPTKEDFKIADKVLQAHNISLSRISASNMRLALKNIVELIDKK